jgi:hypothetical protein
MPPPPKPGNRHVPRAKTNAGHEKASLRRAATTDARDAPFTLVSSLQWARLSERL